jgi:RNase H-fold protein (predicted Holliday junction resolvase)
MRIHIDKFIKTLQIMDDWLEIIRIDENYTSVQAQAITGEVWKHVAHDTLAAIEIINRYLMELKIKN